MNSHQRRVQKRSEDGKKLEWAKSARYTSRAAQKYLDRVEAAVVSELKCLICAEVMKLENFGPISPNLTYTCDGHVSTLLGAFK